MSVRLNEESTEILNTPLDIDGGSRRRIRHITSIQVRNLTPFPVRDAFASALLQPSEQSQFTSHGHLSDDLDVTVGRKRSRRISANSFNTIKSRKSEEGTMGDEVQSYGMGSPEHRGRLRRGSKVSYSGGGSSGLSTGTGSSGRGFPSAGTTPTVRPNRPRTSSMASSNSSHFRVQTPSVTAPSSLTGPVFFSAMLPDNSQKGLEKVIKSRLVETFISITVPSSSPSSPSRDNQPESPSPSPQSRSSTPPNSVPPQREKFPSMQRKVVSTTNHTIRKGIKVTPSSPSNASKASAMGSPSARRETTSPRPRAPIKSSTLTRTPSSSRLNGKTQVSSPSASSQKTSSPLSPSPRPHIPAPTTATRTQPLRPPIPDYLSQIHRPSTNPSFPIDPLSRHEFAEWTDVSGEKLKVEVWGKVGFDWHGIEDVDRIAKSKGKGKERERNEEWPEDESDRSVWKVLEEWSINLADLVPLPEDLASHPSHLPSNTLLVVLAPHGQTYYLPPPKRSSRPPSPSAGYNSDPESAYKNMRGVGELILPASSRGFADPRGDASIAARKQRNYRRNGNAAHQSGESLKTAGWQDLLKLITLQSVILDTEESLSNVVREIDRMLEGDVIGVLKREASERENLVEDLRIQSSQVEDASDDLRHRIASRREQLRIRKETLAQAQAQLAVDASHQSGLEEELTNERTRLLALQKNFAPTRTTLITALSAIFPIELLSPPDLLFTILSVPLPIPLSSSDPGPPLSLSDHKDVTEDAVATALGYGAQVVQVLAAYLGKGLVYPVTCVGSRSLIRDGISAMVGPRMFPLFSKGVETYRFEYGVFLLNKDIEMLMADRDLRALDMRHTLPNLKNLLLTLTDGDGARLTSSPPALNSPVPSASGLESPRAKSPPTLTLTPSSPHDTDHTRQSGTEIADGNTTPSSGATTPTHDRKTQSLLGLYPLTGFLRTRYPSIVGRPSVKSVAETSEGLENGDASAAAPPHSETGDDDEDRQTIRGVVMESEPMQEGKEPANGQSVVNGEARPWQKEKFLDGAPPLASNA
ncbi:hypothetical protein PILCRDRAFT_818278 [Piloderma croceum F 1598]|uniref:Uncharacterized protein n=1 Tax=Piloderma croceum (strain F 1598) TaxID=765440 RepID=A0A0C3FKU9_PILCF|nr:hypothetical protein PILCRDRAFT_818278 [Piloderma croceum F 1598]